VTESGGMRNGSRDVPDNRIISSRTRFGLNTRHLQMVRRSIWRRALANNVIRAEMFPRPAAPDAGF